MELVPTFLQSAVSSYSAKSALFTVGVADRGVFFDCTGSFTISLTAAATLGTGFSFWVRNVSGSQIIDPNVNETINGGGVFTYTVSNPGDVVLVVCSSATSWVISQTQLPSAVAITGGTINGVTISGVVTQASTAEIAAETTVTKYVSPERIRNAPSTQKAWVCFTSTGTVTILGSYNTTSVTDNGVGDFTHNFTTALANTNYAVGGCTTVNGNGQAIIIEAVSGTARTVSVSRFQVINSNNGAGIDASYISYHVLGTA